MCADGFDDIAAKVVCRSGSFQNGISVCCSAFGKMKYDIGYYDIKCKGDEASILDCEYKTGPNKCPSKKYASVACSNQPASGRKLLFCSLWHPFIFFVICLKFAIPAIIFFQFFIK